MFALNRPIKKKQKYQMKENRKTGKTGKTSDNGGAVCLGVSHLLKSV